MLRRVLLWGLAAVVLVGTLGAGIGWYLYRAQIMAREGQFDHIIFPVAREFEVDPALIRALIWRETNFDPTQRGTSGERGLMQLMPTTGREWAEKTKVANFNDDDLLNPETNIRAGTWYLSRALKRWKDRDNAVPFALAEYNAGRARALTWVDPAQPQSHDAFMARVNIASTKNYIVTIERKRQEYDERLAGKRSMWW